MAVHEWLDDLIRAFSQDASRRRAMRALLGGLSGALGLADAERAAAYLCNPPCNACHECVKLSCHPHERKKHCRLKTHCHQIANDSPCNGSGRCRGGTCNPAPVCLPALSACRTDDPEQCCSGVCVPTIPLSGFCLAGQGNTPCFVDSDCLSEICVGYRCAPCGDFAACQ